MEKIYFEDYLKENIKQGNEFRLVVNVLPDGATEFYIHPLGRDGTTFDAWVIKDNVYNKTLMDKLASGLKTPNPATVSNLFFITP